MPGRRERWKSLFRAPQAPLYQEQLMAGTQAKHDVAAPVAGTQIDHYIRHLLRIMTARDWDRYGTQISIVKMASMSERRRPNYSQFRTLEQVPAIFVALPSNVWVGITADGMVRNLMPAFDSNKDKFYRTHQIIKTDHLSPRDKQFLEKELRKRIKKIEGDS